MLKDGAKAWEVKDFLVKQEKCAEVTIENQNFPGAGAKVIDTWLYKSFFFIGK